MGSKVCLLFGSDYEDVCTLHSYNLKYYKEYNCIVNTLVAHVLFKNTFLRIAYTNNCC